MKVNKYLVITILFFILIGCSAQSTANFNLSIALPNLSFDDNLQSMEELVEKAQYIILGEIAEETIANNSPEGIEIRVLEQFKGKEDLQKQRITIYSDADLTYKKTAYLLFLSEDEQNEKGKIMYISIIHPNPILNNKFIDGPFNNMAYKDIRRDIIYMVKHTTS